MHAKTKQWDPISSEGIADNLLALHRVLGKNKFQKYISHFGGLHVGQARVKSLAARGELHKVYTVMKIDKKGRLYFLVVEDPTHAIYSTWVKRIAGDKLMNWETTNDEVFADNSGSLSRFVLSGHSVSELPHAIYTQTE
jgi:hypothetical protein